jgi:hypothetical protein
MQRRLSGTQGMHQRPSTHTRSLAAQSSVSSVRNSPSGTQ